MVNTVSSHLTNLSVSTLILCCSYRLERPQPCSYSITSDFFFLWYIYQPYDFSVLIYELMVLGLRYSMPTLFNLMQFVVIYLRFCHDGIIKAVT